MNSQARMAGKLEFFAVILLALLALSASAERGDVAQNQSTMGLVDDPVPEKIFKSGLDEVKEQLRSETEQILGEDDDDQQEQGVLKQNTPRATPWYGTMGGILDTRLPATITGMPIFDKTFKEDPRAGASLTFTSTMKVEPASMPAMNASSTTTPLVALKDHKSMHPSDSTPHGTIQSENYPPPAYNGASEQPSSLWSTDTAPEIPGQTTPTMPETVAPDCPETQVPVDRIDLEPLDEAVAYSMGTRCFNCGQVDADGNVIEACPPREKLSVKDWVYKNKIRSYICPSGCLTVKGRGSAGDARMCWHTAQQRLNRRVLTDQNRKQDFVRCFYAGCNGELPGQGRSSASRLSAVHGFHSSFSTSMTVAVLYSVCTVAHIALHQ